MYLPEYYLHGRAILMTRRQLYNYTIKTKYPKIRDSLCFTQARKSTLSNVLWRLNWWFGQRNALIKNKIQYKRRKLQLKWQKCEECICSHDIDCADDRGAIVQIQLDEINNKNDTCEDPQFS